MTTVDVSAVSPALFVTGILFILLIGGSLSLGVLRLFQSKRRQGIALLGSAAVFFTALVLVVERWFA